MPSSRHSNNCLDGRAGDKCYMCVDSFGYDEFVSVGVILCDRK